MKRSTSDIILTIFTVIIFIAITAYFAYAVIGMATADAEAVLAGLVFVILFIFGFIVNGAAFALSLILLILSVIFRSSFAKRADRERPEHKRALKIKGRHIWHYSFLLSYSVIAEVVIYIVGTVIF